MPQLNTGEQELHYQVLGQGFGPPVLMIHGLLLGNMASWYFGSIAQLSKQHRIILYDLRGHGMSGKPKSGYDLKTMLADLEALVAHLELDTFSLIGHSYGALIALHYALQNPDRITRLALVEAPLPAGKSLQMDEFRQQDAMAMVEALPLDLKEQLLRGGRQARRLLERLCFLVDETDLLRCLESEGDIDDELLRSLKPSTQLIYGESSQLWPVGQRLRSVIPDSRFDSLKGGHYLPSEQPEALGQVLGDFFA